MELSPRTLEYLFVDDLPALAPDLEEVVTLVHLLQPHVLDLHQHRRVIVTLMIRRTALNPQKLYNKPLQINMV